MSRPRGSSRLGDRDVQIIKEALDPWLAECVVITGDPTDFIFVQDLRARFTKDRGMIIQPPSGRAVVVTRNSFGMAIGILAAFRPMAKTKVDRETAWRGLRWVERPLTT